MESFCLAIEIGGTKLQLVRGTAEGQILGSPLRLEVKPSAGALGIRQQIESHLGSLLEGKSVGAIGVGFGGPIDRRTGCVARSHQIEGWSGFDLSGWLTGKTQLPVVVDNDANMAALGEARRGAGQGAETVFYVTLGSGVGGGCVTQGEVYHGAAPGESEIGHLRLDRAGTILEERCSGWAIDRRIRELKNAGTKGRLCERARAVERGEAQFLAEALSVQDPVAMQILNELAADLAFGLSSVVHLFHPDVLVLGGGLAGIGEPLRAAVAAALSPLVMAVFAPGPAVCLARLEPFAVPTGCLLAAGQRLRAV